MKNSKFKGLQRVCISELQPADLFTVTSEKGYLLSKVTDLGAGQCEVIYRNIGTNRRYISIWSKSKKVFVAPIGRYYKSSHTI